MDSGHNMTRKTWPLWQLVKSDFRMVFDKAGSGRPKYNGSGSATLL